MKILWFVCSDEKPDFELGKAQKDILEHWSSGDNLFSVTQIANRNGISRGAAKRAIGRLGKAGIVRRYTGGHK